MRMLPAICGLVLALAQPAEAQVDDSVGDSAVLLGGEDEVYIAGLPAGWSKQAEVSDALGYRGDWLPAGQSLEGWRDRITLQVIPEIAPQSLGQFLDNLAALWTQSCAAVMATDIETESVNGYAVGSRVIACTREQQSGMGSVSLYRVIAGEAALYVIQRAYRIAPFSTEAFPLSPQILAAGRASVGYGLACQRGGARRPCPADWRPVLAPLDSGRRMVVFPATQ